MDNNLEKTVNVYVLETENAPEDETMLYNTIPNMLSMRYGVTNKKKILTGDLIDDADFIADRLEKEPDAWLVLLTEKEVCALLPENKQSIIERLRARPNEKASVVLDVPPEE